MPHMQPPDQEERLNAPPPYRPSIDRIFLDKLSESDRYLVTKLDSVDQRIEWLIIVALSSHNRGIDLASSVKKLEERVGRLEQVQATATDDKKLLKWIRENAMAPAKIVGWLIAAGVGAVLVALAERMLTK
jgi:hypothetical protein